MKELEEIGRLFKEFCKQAEELVEKSKEKEKCGKKLKKKTNN